MVLKKGKFSRNMFTSSVHSVDYELESRMKTQEVKIRKQRKQKKKAVICLASYDNISRRISPEYLNDFSVSSKQWFFSSLVQLFNEKNNIGVSKTYFTAIDLYIKDVVENETEWKWEFTRYNENYLSNFIQLVPHIL